MEDEGPQPLPQLEEDSLILPRRKEQHGEQQGEKRAAPPSGPTASSPKKGEDNKKRKLKWQSKCLMKAGVEVKFPEEG